MGELNDAVRDVFAPALRDAGFRGSGRTYRRSAGDSVRIVHLQGSKRGDGFSVEIGVHLARLPQVGGVLPAVRPVSEVSVYGCLFRLRLGSQGRDEYDNSSAHLARESCRRAASDVLASEREGGPFSRLSGRLAELRNVSPADLVLGRVRTTGEFGISGLPQAGEAFQSLILALVRTHNDDPEMAQVFSSLGLEYLGEEEPKTIIRLMSEAVTSVHPIIESGMTEEARNLQLKLAPFLRDAEMEKRQHELSALLSRISARRAGRQEPTASRTVALRSAVITATLDPRPRGGSGDHEERRYDSELCRQLRQVRAG